MPKRSLVVPALPALALAVLLLAAACAAVRHQHAVEGEDGGGANALAGGNAPAAAPAATPASDAFKGLALDQQLSEVRGEVQAVKRRLREEGKYDCCVMPACNQCLLQHGECHCRKAVEQEGGPCCGECTEAWLDGRGMVDGVDAWELLERKKKQQPAPPEADGEKPPGAHRPHHDGHGHRHGF